MAVKNKGKMGYVPVQAAVNFSRTCAVTVAEQSERMHMLVAERTCEWFAQIKRLVL